MTNEDFRVWYADFRHRFPSIVDWEAKHERSPDGRSQTLKTWRELLENVSLDHALEANLAIQRGDYELAGWQAVPRQILGIAGELAFQEARNSESPDLDQQRFKCSICRDSGLVLCWHVHAMQAARKYIQGEQAAIDWKTCGVPCSCAAGDRYAVWYSFRGKSLQIDIDLPRYSDSWVRADGSEDEARDRLLAWSKNWKPLNRHDFGEYSGSGTPEDNLAFLVSMT